MRVGSWVGIARVTLGLLATLAGGTGLAGCKDFDTCEDPGRVEACACPDDVFGARACLPEQIWGECDCSVEGALPDSGMPGVTGGAGGTATGGVGGSMTGGTGGTTTGGTGGSMTGGVGGSMTGGTGGMDDSGMPMMDASDDAMAGTGGVPSPAYAGCTVATVDADCRTGSTCIASDTPLLGVALRVCAPACSMADDCPEAEGTFTATIECVAGRCQLACSNDIFAPKTCPTGMTCSAKDLIQLYCYDDGV